MKKIFKLIIFNLIIFLLTYSIYFIFYSKDLYRIPNFLPLFYPRGYIIVSLVMLIANLLLKANKIFIFVSIIISCQLFYITTPYLQNSYGVILEDFYYKRDYENLLQLSKYKKEKGNYITLTKLLEPYGIVPELIDEGLHEGELKNGRPSDFAVPRENYTKLCYLINSEKYILVDWENLSILDVVHVNDIKEKFVEQLGLSKNEVSIIPAFTKLNFEIIKNGVNSYNYYSIYIFPGKNKIEYHLVKGL